MSGFARRLLDALLPGLAQVGLYFMGGPLHEGSEDGEVRDTLDAPPPGGPERLVPDRPLSDQELLIARDLWPRRGRLRRPGR
ncbi:DUF6059 family protein [Spirillospora sp. CA-253888]